VGQDDAVTDASGLPFVDEHATTIAADQDLVRVALLATLDRAFSRRGAAAYARLVGCVPSVASGPRPLTVGSTVPGFEVTAAAPDGQVVLEGRHRFSTYALIFRLDAEADGRTRLRAETRASFPGVTGGIYRALAIGSRGHVLGTRRLLAAVRRRSEPGRA
jgi:hypothetical protein